MINLIKNYYKKGLPEYKREAEIDSRKVISVMDFGDKLFIAFDGKPLIPVENEAMPFEIINQLREMRKNYVDSVVKDYKEYHELE